MSSLLQFNGQISKKGVRLEFYHTAPSLNPLFSDMPSSGQPRELVPCHICNKTHEQLWTTWRKPKGMFGCWVVFRINGKNEVPDLSIPIATFRLPKDAIKLTPEENSNSWHR
jgi:hypothetical protein